MILLATAMLVFSTWKDCQSALRQLPECLSGKRQIIAEGEGEEEKKQEHTHPMMSNCVRCRKLCIGIKKEKVKGLYDDRRRLRAQTQQNTPRARSEMAAAAAVNYMRGSFISQITFQWIQVYPKTLGPTINQSRAIVESP